MFMFAVFMLYISIVVSVYADELSTGSYFEVAYEITIDPSLRHVTSAMGSIAVTPASSPPSEGRYIFSHQPVKTAPFFNMYSDRMVFRSQMISARYIEDAFREVRYFPAGTTVAFESFGEDSQSDIYLFRFWVCSFSDMHLFEVITPFKYEIVLTEDMADTGGMIINTADSFGWFFIPVAVYVPEIPTTSHAPHVIRFTIGSNAHTINGIPHTNDVAPFIDFDYNRTMIPVRAVSEALGAETDWIAQTGSVQITTGSGTHQLTVGTPLPDGMGVPASLQGRVFVPIRYVAEVLGATVRWDEENSAVYIYQ